MIKHKYIASVITPGRCGASELVSGTQGHFVCCGKPESHETHNQAHCPVCLHHFTPLDEPLCPRCASYAPEAFDVLMKRPRGEAGPADEVKTQESKMTVHDVALIRRAILTVIDDGPFKCGISKDPRDDIWELYEGGVSFTTEAEANAQRLDFCNAIQNYVVDRLAPALKGNA